MDYVLCSNCDFTGLVSQEERKCPDCDRKGTLRWTYSICCNAEIKKVDSVCFCSKCEMQIP